jgi:hypothetical protein
MKKLLTMLYHGIRRIRIPTLWRHVGRPVVTIASGILLAIVIVHGESWAIRQAPLLPTASVIAPSAAAGCIPEDNPATGELPVAILH